MDEKISVIIPARNEEKYIRQTVESYQRQGYMPLEIIVVVNDSCDKTYEIAKNIADRCINIKDIITVGRARNIGAEQATGEIYVFSDADTRLEPGGLKKIADLSDYNTIGIPLGKGDDGGIKGKIFFFYKNFGHKLGFYKGAIFGILFCHKDIFLKTNGFDPVRRIAEYSDFIKRAIKAGGDYKLLKDCCAITSLRRFERNGYTKEYLFWIKWRLLSLVNKSENLEKEYFNK